MMDCSNARAYYGAPPPHRYEASTDRKLGGLLLCVVGTRKRVYARLKNVHYAPTRVYAPLPVYTHPPRIRTTACVYAHTSFGLARVHIVFSRNAARAKRQREDEIQAVREKACRLKAEDDMQQAVWQAARRACEAAVLRLEGQGGSGLVAP